MWKNIRINQWRFSGSGLGFNTGTGTDGDQRVGVMSVSGQQGGTCQLVQTRECALVQIHKQDTVLSKKFYLHFINRREMCS